jgi:hypothetical protein
VFDAFVLKEETFLDILLFKVNISMYVDHLEMIIGFFILSIFFLYTYQKESYIKKALKESEERWKFAVDGSGQGLWDWNMITDDVFLRLI